jgi:diadenosine tetraphosphate (Ap4A) HIT family hydrolase
MFALGRRVAASLRGSGLPCEGINFFLADGVAAGQTVLHSHLHVIPRVRGDGLGFRHGLGRGRMSRLELDELASRLAARI